MVDTAAKREGSPRRGPKWLWSWRWRAVAFGLIVLVAVIGAVLTSGRGAQQKAPDASPLRGPAPEFSVARLGQPGSTIKLSDLRGRPVVVNFFASWCPPCRQELPMLSAADRRLNGSVTFVGIDVSDTTKPALDLVHSSGVTYQLGVDPDYKVSDSTYHLRGLPATVFIDANGNINGTVLGQLNSALLDEHLQALTGRKS